MSCLEKILQNLLLRKNSFAPFQLGKIGNTRTDLVKFNFHFRKTPADLAAGWGVDSLTILVLTMLCQAQYLPILGLAILHLKK